MPETEIPPALRGDIYFIRNCLHRGVDSFFIEVQQNGFGFFATSIQIPATLIEKSEMEGGVICQDQEDRAVR